MLWGMMKFMIQHDKEAQNEGEMKLWLLLVVFMNLVLLPYVFLC